MSYSTNITEIESFAYFIEWTDGFAVKTGFFQSDYN